MADVLDTNVISEVIKPSPNARMMDWLTSQPPRSLFLSVMTIAEVRYGLERLPAGRRKTSLFDWLRDLTEREYLSRLLPVGRPEADLAGQLMARVVMNGLAPNLADCVIAATAITHGFAVATRNEVHFAPTGAALINPWNS